MEEVVLDHYCLLGEGPVWDSKRKTICWVDILLGEIHEFNPINLFHKIFSIDQMIGAVVICKSGDFLASMKNGFGFINRNSGSVTMIGNPESDLPGNRFNDGKIDPAGRFWAGTMSHTDEPGQGSLYVLEKDLTIRKKIEKISISNGLAWKTDHKTFYYIDTPTRMVVSYQYDKLTGDIRNKKVVINVPQADGFPDGMTIDSDDMLWIAHWDGWQISRWNPENGKKLLTIRLPVARVTSCCFGGDGFGDLYITSARTGLHEEQLKNQPLAGSLFVIKGMGYHGLPAFEFEK